MTSAISQDDINAAVWAACDTLRGIVSPDMCREYVLTMLFLKHISDAWQHHRDAYQSQYGDHPELVEEMLKNERFVVPAHASFRALHAQRHMPGNGERIDRAFHALEEANLPKLRDVFQDISFNANHLGDERQKNDTLRRLLEAFAKPPLEVRTSGEGGSLSAISHAYEFVFRSFAAASGKNRDEFYTPAEVATLVACLMDPKPGDEICDPTCGCGSLLMACGRVIRERTGSRHYALFGQEAMGGTWALAKMNLYVHADDNHRIEWGDTLRDPKLLDGAGGLKHFDIVVAHPPFSLENWGHEGTEADRFSRFRRGVPPRTKADYAFILHMVETMKPVTGRMAVVVPHGVLFRGATEGRIRRKLVEENLLDVVIGLPEKLFYGTGIPAAVLVLRKRKTDDQVLFIDASRHFGPGKNRNVLRQTDLQRLLDTVAARQSVARYAHLATPAEMAANDFNLNISRYVDTFEAQDGIDLGALLHEREQLRNELILLEAQMGAHMKELGFE